MESCLNHLQWCRNVFEHGPEWKFGPDWYLKMVLAIIKTFIRRPNIGFTKSKSINGSIPVKFYQIFKQIFLLRAYSYYDTSKHGPDQSVHPYMFRRPWPLTIFHMVKEDMLLSRASLLMDLLGFFEIFLWMLLICSGVFCVRGRPSLAKLFVELFSLNFLIFQNTLVFEISAIPDWLTTVAMLD